MIDQILAWVGNAIAQIINRLYEGVSAVLDWVVALFQGIGNVLWEALASMFASLQDGLLIILNSINDTLTGIVDGVWQFLSNAWDTIYEATIGVLDSIGNYANELWATLEAFINIALEELSGFVASVAEWIRSVADAAISGVTTIVGQATQFLVGLVSEAAAAVQFVIQNVAAVLNAAWEQLVLGAEAIILAVNERLAGLREAFADAATQLVSEIGDLSGDVLEPLRDAVQQFSDAYLPKDDPATSQRALKALEGIHTDPSQMADYRAWWEGEWRHLAESGPLRKGILLTIIFLLSMLPTVMGISNLLSQTTLQEYSKHFPHQILNPADATAAYRRDLITRGEAIEQIRKGGFDERKAEDIVELTSLVPDIGQIIQMWWRGEINEPMFDRALKHKGIDEPWRGHIKAIAEVIPPVPDLIHMAVRDVWNEEAVAIGRLHDDYPPPFGEWTEKQGLSEEWSRKYWAAHWSLPSARQGFEMLHRSVIDDAQLGILLRALDVAPGWREPLKAIAFNPFTRVDVRRMHKLDVLTEAEVTRAYRDLGYDQDKALALTEFTVELNRPKSADDTTELGELSRTGILGFYSDGVLPRDKAQELLVDAGYTSEAAALYLDSEDAGEQRAERKTESALLIEQAEAGVITFEEAADKLRGLGLETKEVEKAITSLLRAEQRKTKIPSRADADSFFVAGLLQESEYLDLVSRNGYSQKWAQKYLALARAKRQKTTRG